ncbi:putative metal homeostasis protein [Listeria costaricensis]|nr:putative metal homeostasis protein [Listeria costaricensis]
MAEKMDLSSAYRRMRSRNAKTRKRALKIIQAQKRKKTRIDSASSVNWG